MDNIFEAWEFVNFLCNTYMNGYLSPEEVSKAFDAAQKQLWYRYVGERQNGNELALVALKPFYETTVVATNSSGFAAYPSLWAETQAMYINNVSVLPVLHNELSEALKSKIYPISDNPRWLEQKTGVQIYPKLSFDIDWNYLRQPISPVIGYTVNVNEVVYDPLSSVQFEFDKQYWIEIIQLSLPYLGLNLSNENVVAAAQTYQLNANNGSDGN